MRLLNSVVVLVFTVGSFLITPDLWAVTANNTNELVTILANNQTGGTLIVDLVSGTTYELTQTFDQASTNGVQYTALPAIIQDVVINGNGATILRRNNLADGYMGVRALYVLSGSLTVRNLTFEDDLTHGSFPGNGAAIYSEAPLIVENCTFNDNRGSFGAAIVANDALTIRNSIFQNNHSVHGAIYIENNRASLIESSEFRDNVAQDDVSLAGTGGAIKNDGAALVIRDCLFSGNQGREKAGAVYSSGLVGGADGSLTISGSTFINNSTAGTDGGAILMDKGTLLIQRSSFVGNQAKLSGGAISLSHLIGDWQIFNSTFYDNEATLFFGGGINSLSAHAHLENVTMIGNTAASSGGGFDLPTNSGTVILKNVIIAGNHADHNPNCDGTITTITNSLLGSVNLNVSGCDIPTDQQNSFSSLADDQVIGTIVGNFETGHFSLICNDTNPAINRGDCTKDYRDQLGKAAVESCDIGAVESDCLVATKVDPDNSNNNPSPTPAGETTAVASSCQLSHQEDSGTEILSNIWFGLVVLCLHLLLLRFTSTPANRTGGNG